MNRKNANHQTQSAETEPRVSVQICTGTACYVMGGSDLLLLADEYADNPDVSVRGSSCLGDCQDPAQGKAPFVRINGESMSSATLPRVQAEIERRLSD